jgi:prolyl oligopeptidase
LATLVPVVAANPSLGQTDDPIAVYTPIKPVTTVYHGVSVTEPYRWLEDGADPRVENWTAAENARARAFLDNLPTRAPIKTQLTRLITATSPAYYGLWPVGGPTGKVLAYYSDPARQQPRLVTLNAAADPASRQPLIDPNALDPKGLTTIDWFVPSPDGKSVAVSLSQSGSEDGTLHVYDVATGREIGAPIPRVQYPTAGGSVAWTADGRGFWYTRYPGDEAPQAERHFNMQVYFHTLGGDWRADPLALGTRDGLEKVSEVYLNNRYGRAQILASVERGDGGEWAQYVLSPGKPPMQVATYADKVVSAVIGPDDAIYGISRLNAPNGQVVKLAKLAPGASLGSAPVIVPQSEVAILSDGAPEHVADLSFDSHHMFVRDIVGGPDQVRIFDLAGRFLFNLPLPPIASNSEIAPLADGDVLFDVSTYLKPRYYERWTPATGATQETALAVTSPIDLSAYEVVRAFATSRDGTKVPMNIIRRRGLVLNGQNPTLLYGYGGYGISMTPGFIGAMRSLWLDAGGVYVVANIRGGSEYGERWHQLGALLYKQNVFDDFAAAGQALIDTGYTSHAKLALMGGSNGGLLMGAMITQHPGLAHAVISAVGIYDMLRVELDPNGAFNTTEFGSVQDEAQFKTLYSYSPYHHVRPGPYPAVLMLTGAHDGRVNPMQSRKFTAALQAANTSDAPILLRTSANSGHGIGSSLSERIDEQTDELEFLFAELGMRYPPAGR